MSKEGGRLTPLLQMVKYVERAAKCVPHFFCTFAAGK